MNWAEELLKFDPIPVPRVWGGTRLHPSKSFPEPVGESWLVSCCGSQPKYHSRVTHSSHSAPTLRELIDADPSAILGDLAERSNEFPLLLKLIDAAAPLSVQVHPGDELARELGEPYGKTEAWLVIAAEPGAEIVYGLDDGQSYSDYLEAAERGEGAAGLKRIPVERGDFIFLPAGALHAIGAGILLLEIQQASDTTYRIYDWDRVGLDGQPRELHLSEAKRVEPPAPYPICPIPRANERGRFRDCLGSFTAPFRAFDLAGPSKALALPTSTSFGLLALIEGELLFRARDREWSLGAGEAALVPPALMSGTITTSAESWLLFSAPEPLVDPSKPR